uniref:EGF-like domain-containing protein n=1 Tax=Bursaphelenchus xylophilus TaxID=6326 RepID=A0A1I7SJK5_BURXY
MSGSPKPAPEPEFCPWQSLSGRQNDFSKRIFAKKIFSIFSFNDKIRLNLSEGQEILSPDMSMHLRTAVDPRSSAETPLKIGLQINTNRFGECPDGYVRIKDHCKDIDECALDKSVCAGRSACRNTFGGFECELECPEGFAADEMGECADVNECTLGMFDCDLGMECRNTNGSYDCVEACAEGYFMEHTGDCVGK